MLIFLLPGIAGMNTFRGKAGGDFFWSSGDSVRAQSPSATPTATPNPNSNQKVYAFIEAPQGPLDHPYVILSGYQSASDDPAVFEIRGMLDLKEFVCQGASCNLPVTDGSVIRFRAYASPTAVSDEVQATLRVYMDSGGYFVTVESPSQIFKFTDSCGTIWKAANTSAGTWSEFPQFPSRLNTNKQLHYLAYRLITHGIVDASSCSGGGLTNGAPNGCGIEKAADAMRQWQNRYDYSLWLAGKEYGIPPKLLKTLIETESQFWPANERVHVDEIGLGQLNQLGMDVSLRQNPALYQQACSTVLNNCSMPYASLPPDLQAMVRGALLKSINADCPTCAYGLNFDAADQSISLIALTLRANCSQVKSLLDEYFAVATYEDGWKYTLVSYHSGFGCLQSAINAAYTKTGVVNWNNVSAYLACYGARDYVDKFWISLATFDNAVIKPDAITKPQIIPTFIPSSPTPSPTPVPVLSHAVIAVAAVQDKNGNGLLEDSDWLVGIPVEITLKNNIKLTGVTAKGPVFFDMSRYPAGTQVNVSLPTLYQGSSVQLPDQGMVPVIFIFNQPVLPTFVP